MTYTDKEIAESALQLDNDVNGNRAMRIRDIVSDVISVVAICAATLAIYSI